MNSPRWFLTLFIFLLIPGSQLHAAATKKTILAFGDSLTAGYGLPATDSFPTRLEEALNSAGYQVKVINAGISGDTSAGGVARISWSLAEKPDLAIVELGANDALRGLNPQDTRKNLAFILTQLNKAGVKTILAGMKAPRNLGENYYTSFDRIYPELATQYQVELYPFFLQGVVGITALNQVDGIHPNAAGVKVIVKQILPLVEKVLQRS